MLRSPGPHADGTYSEHRFLAEFVDTDYGWHGCQQHHDAYDSGSK